MTDDLPTDERLRRIERGVHQRIDRRRRLARRIAGASVAVVLVAGGIALVRPQLATTSGASSAAGGSAEGTSAGTVTVLCHRGAAVTPVQAERRGLPASALAACTTAQGATAASARPRPLDGRTPSPAPTPVLCASPSGVLHVYLGSATTCAAHRLQPRG
jgi:hypothetical protein